MRNILKIICILLLISFVSCEKERAPENIEHVGTYYGGANNFSENDVQNISNYKSEQKRDTTIYYFKNDTLVIFVEFSYFCCTPFDALYEISNDTISLNIFDACTPFNSPCYCKANCNYSFEYSFSSLDAINYHYTVNLYNADKDTTIALFSGLIENIFN